MNKRVEKFKTREREKEWSGMKMEAPV
jgi:hypothetical protein